MFASVKKIILQLAPAITSASLLAQGNMPAANVDHVLYAGEMNAAQAKALISPQAKQTAQDSFKISKNLGYLAQVAEGINRERLIHILKSDSDFPEKGDTMFGSSFGQQLIQLARTGASDSASVENAIQAGLVLNMVVKLKLDSEDLGQLSNLAPKILANLKLHQELAANRKSDYNVATDAAKKFSKQAVSK